MRNVFKLALAVLVVGGSCGIISNGGASHHDQTALIGRIRA